MDETRILLALDAALQAPAVRRGLRRRRPPVSVAVFLAALPGDEELVAGVLQTISKGTDVVGVLGSAAVATVLANTDDAGVRAYVTRVHTRLPVVTTVGVATGQGEADTADALLRAAWPAG